MTPQQNGCSSASAGSAAFFCDYVEQVILRDPKFGKTPEARAKLLATGGLKIYTTLSPQDQRAANNAVNYWVPPHGGRSTRAAMPTPRRWSSRAPAGSRPSPKTGPTAPARARPPSTRGRRALRRRCGSPERVLQQAVHADHRAGAERTVRLHDDACRTTRRSSGITNCDGQTLAPYSLVNASKSDAGTFSLYTGTTQSINTFYANLEQKVGLCNVVKTAVALGDHRADGTSLWSHHGGEVAADNITSFTLGSVNVSPLTMAAAYATVAARGTYCKPVAITKIVTDNGKSLQVPKANCHRAIKPGIADAVSYILQGVLVNGTAAGEGLNRPSAGKTGTGDGPHYVDFAGYTPTLVSYTSVFQPRDPITHPMVGVQACYRGGCPGTMFGANAPAQTWHTTFMHADLGPPINFVPVNPASPLFSHGQRTDREAEGQARTTTRPGPGGGGGGGGGGGHHHCPKHVPFCPPTG